MQPTDPFDTPAPSAAPRPRRRHWKGAVVAGVAASVVAGGAVGAALTASSPAGAQTAPTTPSQAQTDTAGPAVGHRGGPGGPGGSHEAVSDDSVAAAAIGISEADLTSALQSGQSMAAVAKAHNVDPQKVIDALVADEEKEVADRVTAGEITQAQADQMKAGITQRITNRVNGTAPQGGPGHGHGHGFRGPGGPGQPPAGQPSATG